MLFAQSDLMEVLQIFDNDLLGAVLVLMTIGTFVTVIVSIVSITRTWNNLSQIRMNQALVKDLLNQGYSVDEIERLVYGGGPSWSNRFKRMMQSARESFGKASRRYEYANNPVPPVKQSA